MQKPSYTLGIILGAVTGLPLAAVFYLGGRLKMVPFIPFDVFDWYSRVLPGGLITFVIDILIRLIRVFNAGPTAAAAKTAEQIIAVILFLCSTAFAGFVITAAVRRLPEKPLSAGAGTGLEFFAFIALIESALGRFSVVAALFTALILMFWGALIGSLLDQSVSRAGITLKRITVTSLIVAMAAYVAGFTAAIAAGGIGGADIPLVRVRASTGAPAFIAGIAPVEKRTGIAPVPGSRPEVTPARNFFRVDIDTTPPLINAGTWKMKTSGLFSGPRDIGYEELMSFPEFTQPITLCCISNPVAGDLIGTVFFTGIRLCDLLDGLGIREEAQALVVRSADGYYECVSHEDMYDPRTLLVYGLNGRTLTAEQGFPLRLYIPDRYGMKQPKWITSIEAVAKPVNGFWEDRGWSREARPQIIAIIDRIASGSIRDGKVPIGGVAFAGGRGIQRVELQVDDGPWNEVKLLEPALGPLTWVLWRYDWPVRKGAHTFRVRAVDGTGAVQQAASSPPHPAGATGYHEMKAVF